MKNVNEKQIILITKATAIACLASILLSWKLWLSKRNFPTVAIFDFLPELIHPVDYLLLGAALTVLSVIILLKKPAKAIIIFLLIGFILALFDLNRWQPWFYQYMIMFFVLSFYNYSTADIKHTKAIVLCFKLLICAIYFWSGFQKLNPKFISDTFPWLMEPITSKFGEGSIHYFNWLGFAFPLIEITTGVLLLLNKSKKTGTLLAIAMHVFILFSLGPLGHNYNVVVWPWNVFMIFINWQLFYNSDTTTSKDFIYLKPFYSIKFILILFVLMPLFNFFNKWDSYLSHNLYSGNTSNGIIYVSDQVKEHLPKHIQHYVSGTDNQLPIKYWCMNELGVPPYPERRNFSAIAATFYKYATDSSEIYFEFIPKIKVKL